MMIGRTLAHYEVLERLESGPGGVLYRARDVSAGDEVTLHVLPDTVDRDPEALARLERRVGALASLDHPALVRVLGMTEADGVRFVVTEPVTGKTLEEEIPPRGMSAELLLKTAIPLADGLPTAHELGLLHLGLVPAVIHLTEAAAPTVDGFVAAGLRGATEETGGAHAPASITPYTAPEQAEGRPADARADVFAFGAILYRMATGRPPFGGDTEARLAHSLRHDDPPAPTQIEARVPVSLSRVILNCLEKDPAHRPPGLFEVRRRLEEVQAGRRRIDVPSIAVLPFADMSPEKDQEYFCDGIAEELINDLAKIGGLHVASRTSAFLFKRSALDIRGIGRELAVTTVLEGSVRKSGDRLRITAQLIDVATGYHIWSERYDREVEDLFRIQDEIARSIVQALRVTLTPGEERTITAASTTDVQAYDYYLRGRNFYYQYRRRGIELAQQMFQHAIQHDKRYARAYAGIADCCCFLYLNAERSAEYLHQADEASRRALELDPDLAEAHASRGLVLSLAGLHVQARGEFETAIRLGPRLFDAYYFYARDCFTQGKLEEAVRYFELASEMSPEDYQSLLLVAQIYEDMGRPAQATAARQRGVEVVERRLRLHPEDVRALYMGANGLIALGKREKALEWAELALEMEPRESMVLYNVACVFSMAGRIDDALDCLERAVRAGLTHKEWIDHDNNLDPLREHPRFTALMDWLDRNVPRLS
jgi:TolB-like protein/Flp pilus assembly protein TadD